MRAERISERLEANGIPFAPELPERIRIYLDLLQEWNGRMDLTAVEGEEDLLDRHFLDSLTVLKTDLLAGAERIIDVGTGAGFPGMAIALAKPGIRVVLLDSQRKRLSFLQAVADATGAGNIEIVHALWTGSHAQPQIRNKIVHDSLIAVSSCFVGLVENDTAKCIPLKSFHNLRFCHHLHGRKQKFRIIILRISRQQAIMF